MANQIDVDLDGNEYPLSPGSGGVVIEIVNGGTGATYPERARVNLGLGNVDNTSDLNKPVSTAQQAAIDAEAAARAAAVSAEVTARAAADAAEVTARNAAIAAAQLSVQKWLPSVEKRADLPAPSTLSHTTSYLCRVINDTATPANNGVWQLIAQATQWTYFSDNLDFVDETELNAALASKANLASPTFTGTPRAPTATKGTNTTRIATTAFVTGAISTAVPSPLTVAKGGTGASTAAAARTSLGAAPLASPAFTGTPTCPTPSYP